LKRNSDKELRFLVPKRIWQLNSPDSKFTNQNIPFQSTNPYN